MKKKALLMTTMLIVLTTYSFRVEEVSAVTENYIRTAIESNAIKALSDSIPWHYLWGAEGELPNEKSPLGYTEVKLIIGSNPPEAWDVDTGEDCGYYEKVQPVDCTPHRHTDCSGLVFWAYTNWNDYGTTTGINYPTMLDRLTAAGYYNLCYQYNKIYAPDSPGREPGDLLFVQNATGHIVHVGILLSGDVVVHAHGSNDQRVVGWGLNYWIQTYSPPNYDTDLGDLVAALITKFPSLNQTGVGGIVIPVDKFGLLAPYIGLASTILVATVATAIYVKRVKHRKEKQ